MAEKSQSGMDRGDEWDPKFGSCRATTFLLTCFCSGVTAFFVGRKLQLQNLGIAAVVLFFVFLLLGGSSSGSAKESGESAGILGTIGSLAGIGFVCLVVYFRIKTRQQKDVKGTECEDCLLGFFCAPCTLCQLYENLDLDVFNGKTGSVVETV